MNCRRSPIVALLALALVSWACGRGNQTTGLATPEATPVPTVTQAQPTATPESQGGSQLPAATSQPTPTATPRATLAPASSARGVRQWAKSAVAGSEYGDPDWAAHQATGAPDTPDCGDHATAWASADSGGSEWIELLYDESVLPTEVNVVQSYNPSQVVKVELLDVWGEYHEVYTAEPQPVEECPYTLSIPVTADYQATGVRITVDQSALGDWNEIDAVQLVGVPDRPVMPESTTDAVLLWRVGGDSDAPDSLFTTLGGMDVAGGAVYVADAYNGVYVFDPDGNLAGRVAAGEMGYVVDVKVDPSSGSVYMADAGLHSVFIFAEFEDGGLLGAFGGVGAGDGEFGEDSPMALAIGPDSSVYVLDWNEDAAGGEIVRVQVFTSGGEFVRSFEIEEDVGAKAMDFGPDGNLYALGLAGTILKIAPDDGTVLGRLGEEALGGGLTQGLSIDGEGNFYVTAQILAGALKLDPDGNLTERLGTEATSTDGGWPEGEFMFPVGIAVTADGKRVYIGDTAGRFSYVTAFEYPNDL